MNYEFHVGDYVEAIGGLVGYVVRLRPISEGLYVLSVKYKDHNKCKEYNLYGYELPCFFNRIGAYDFTKEEKKKIEPLEKDLPIEGRLKNKTIEFKQYLDDDYATFIYSGKMIDKINELVDAVNELRDKEDVT